MTAPPSSPTLAITTGDPLGIGPEVLVKALNRSEVSGGGRLLAIGSPEVLERTAHDLALQASFRPISQAAEARYKPGTLDVLEPEGLGANGGVAALPLGRIHPLAGKASVEYVIAAARLALNGEVDAIVTGPINKESVQQAGYHHYIGNTEILEDICARHTGKNFHGRCLTMLITKSLHVAHATRHVPFKEIVQNLTAGKLSETIRLTSLGMRSLGLDAPRIAVAGLNPHSGEGGLMGREEIDLIAPVVERVRQEGIDVTGPVPADSVFFQAIGGAYDAVVALYHDQGHIAVKVHGFEESITVSLGLPVIRTSVDHGTAFDIAGQGKASEKGMVAAIQLAQKIVRTGNWEVADAPPLEATAPH